MWTTPIKPPFSVAVPPYRSSQRLTIKIAVLLPHLSPNQQATGRQDCTAIELVKGKSPHDTTVRAACRACQCTPQTQEWGSHQREVGNREGDAT